MRKERELLISSQQLFSLKRLGNCFQRISAWKLTTVGLLKATINDQFFSSVSTHASIIELLLQASHK